MILEWLNRDPIQELGGLNLYAYVGNDPINFIDLFGLDDVNFVSTWNKRFTRRGLT